MDVLRTFITSQWMLSAAGSMSCVITLLARSADSPVARALAALSPELVSRGISVRAILGQLEPEKTPAGWSVSGPGIGFQRDLRWAKNPRLADAHEQLVLGAETCWIGDCMRRDPSRRDAYEHFVSGDARTTATMALSFERLWTASVPLMLREPGTARAATSLDADAAALAALAARDDTGGPTASTPN